MIDELSLLRGSPYKINQWISINNPTLNEVVDYGERQYFSLVSCLCSTPTDFRVQLLDEFGLDYEEVDEFDFFYSMCKGLSTKETSIFFGPVLDFSDFNRIFRDDDSDFYIKDSQGVIIDRGIFTLITDYLRKMHGIEKHIEIAGNEHTKQYLIEKDRRKQKYQKSKPYESPLSNLVSSMISFSGFKYNYDTVWNLNVYQFMDAVMRTNKFLSYEQLMNGIYAGTVDSSKISQEKLNWMGDLAKS